MADLERRPGAGGRGDAGDLLGGGVSTENLPDQLRRRRAASWRLPPLADGRRDPLDSADEPIRDAELVSWRAAWWHLRRAGLEPVIPKRVLVAVVRRGGSAS
jgi:hypothetical protein